MRRIAQPAGGGQQAAAARHQLHQVVGVGAPDHHAVPQRQHPHAVQRPGASRAGPATRRTGPGPAPRPCRAAARSGGNADLQPSVRCQASGSRPRRAGCRWAPTPAATATSAHRQQAGSCQARCWRRRRARSRVGPLGQPRGAQRARPARPSSMAGAASPPMAAEQLAHVVGQARQVRDAEGQQQRQPQARPRPRPGSGARRGIVPAPGCRATAPRPWPPAPRARRRPGR